MSRLYEIVLVNAGVAVLLALFAEAIGRWLHRPALAHCLWVLALLKLLTPPIWTLDVQVPALATTAKPTLASSQLTRPLPTNRSPIEAGPSDQPARAAVEALPQLANVAKSDGFKSTNWLGLIMWVWLSGTLVIVAIVALRARRFCRVLSEAIQPGDNIRKTVAHLAEDIGIKPPPVWLMSGHVSPMIWSLGGRAQLLLPATLTKQLSPRELETLLMHELAHIRRKDHWVRWIEIVALAVCWWHPVTWLARRRIEEFEEECCDAWVLATLSGAAPTYARALLATVEYVSGARPVLPPLASGLGYVKFLKRRLTMIMHGPRDHRLSRPIWASALVLAALVLPLSGKILPATRAADDDEPAKAEQSTEDGKSQDLDRRLRALESRMDRLLQSVERRSNSDHAQAQDAERRLEQVKQRMAQERQRVEKRLEEAKRQIAQARQRVAEARGQQEETTRERSRSSDTTKDLDQLKEDLQKQVEDAVHQAIDPKRLEQMAQQIEKSVHENLSSERLEAMGKQIEEAVNRAINPEKIEAMERQIEEAINRSLQLEKSDRVRRERSDREREPRAARAGQSSGSRRSADLERRVERLEAKMDRLIEAMEKPQKP